MALLYVVGCAELDSHQNFKDSIVEDVGSGINDPNIGLNRYREWRGAIGQLRNGNMEYEFGWRGARKCIVYYEVDKSSERIVGVRFEGTRDNCRLPL